MIKFLLFMTTPVCGIVMAVAALLIYRRIRKTGALLIAIGFALTSTTSFAIILVGKILSDRNIFDFMYVYQAITYLGIFGIVVAASGFVVLAVQVGSDRQGAT